MGIVLVCFDNPLLWAGYLSNMFCRFNGLSSLTRCQTKINRQRRATANPRPPAAPVIRIVLCCHPLKLFRSLVAKRVHRDITSFPKQPTRFPATISDWTGCAASRRIPHQPVSIRPAPWMRHEEPTFQSVSNCPPNFMPPKQSGFSGCAQALQNASPSG